MVIIQVLDEQIVFQLDLSKIYLYNKWFQHYKHYKIISNNDGLLYVYKSNKVKILIMNDEMNNEDKN